MEFRSQNYLSLVLGFTTSVYFIFASGLFVSPALAVDCYDQPAVWGGAITEKQISTPVYNDFRSGGGMSFNPGQGVSYGFDVELKSYNYSQIFWNYFNLLTPFVSSNTDAAVAKYGADRWKYRCLEVNTVSTGKVSVESSGTISKEMKTA